MSQTTRLKSLLSDGQPHRTDEILRDVYGAEHLGCARISARIKDIRSSGILIDGWRDQNKPTLYWYQMIKHV